MGAFKETKDGGAQRRSVRFRHKRTRWDGGPACSCSVDPASGAFSVQGRQGGPDAPCGAPEAGPAACSHVQVGSGPWGAGASLEELARQAGAAGGLPHLSSVTLSGTRGVPVGLLARATRLTYLDVGEGVDALPSIAGLPLRQLSLQGLADFTGFPPVYFHGQAALEALRIVEVPGFTGLPAGAWRDLTALQELQIGQNKDLLALPGDLLPASRGLDTLLMIQNGLTALEPGWFRDKTELAVCLLIANEFTGLRSDTFDRHPRLEFLELNDNRLRFEQGKRPWAEAFAGLPGLRRLEMRFNEFDHIPPKVFDGLKALELLRIEGQRGEPGLRALPSAMVRRNLALTSIRAHQNRFTSLPPDLMHGLTAVTKVDFSMNPGLTAIPEGFFRDAPGMEKMYFYDTALTELNERTFGALGRMDKLYIQGCRISRLAPAAFAGWTSLRELDLSSNALTTLGPGTFAGMARLRELKLHGNRLGALDPSAACPLVQLTKLTLSQRAPPGGGQAPCLDVAAFPDPAQVKSLLVDKCFAGDPEYAGCLASDDLEVKVVCGLHKARGSELEEEEVFRSLGALPPPPPSVWGARASARSDTARCPQPSSSSPVGGGGPAGAGRRGGAAPGARLSWPRGLGGGHRARGGGTAALQLGVGATLVLAAYLGRQLWLGRRKGRGRGRHDL